MKSDDAHLAAPLLERVGAIAPAVLAFLALGALFAASLRWLIDAWWVNDYYQHGPLVVAAAIWLAWRARARIAAGSPMMAGLVPVGLGIALHVASVPHAERLISLLGLLLVLAGLALLAGGVPALRAVALPLLLIALAFPLPAVARIAPPLAASVAGFAAGAAPLIGVAVVQSGPQLLVGDGALTVGAPCSGLRSLVALSTLAVLLAGVLHGPPLRRMLLVAAAVPLALAANAVRLTALLWVADTYGTASGLAFFHGPSSPLLFALAAGGLLAVTHSLGIDVHAAD